jgi:hypothetical protein
MLRKTHCSEAAHAVQNPKVTLAAWSAGLRKRMNDESSRIVRSKRTAAEAALRVSQYLNAGWVSAGAYYTGLT